MQSENDNIPESLKNLGLLLLLSKFNNFASIKDIIDNIIYTPVSRDQWWFFRLVAYLLNMICLNLRFLYKTLYIYIHFRINLTQFYINFSRQDHQIELSSVSIKNALHPFILSLQSL